MSLKDYVQIVGLGWGAGWFARGWVEPTLGPLANAVIILITVALILWATYSVFTEAAEG